MNIAAPIDPGMLDRRRKAAMVVHLLISDGGTLSLSKLPENLQVALTRELGALPLVDRATVEAVAEEFAAELDAVGLAPPGSHDDAVTSLADHLSPPLAARLRNQLASVRNGDHWPRVTDLGDERIVAILQAESIEVCAVALSKLPVAKAALVLARIPGERARRITYAMSQTADIAPDVVRRIGQSLADAYATQDERAFAKAPVQRLGAILNQSANDTREDVLERLTTTDAQFADEVRRAIFTFKDIATRVKATDIPNCIRAVDAQVLTTAVAAGLAGDAAFVASAEFILDSVSQRMATQIREDAGEMGPLKKSVAEAAMVEVTSAIREMAEKGLITMIDPDSEEDT